jgi:hypothetical protein
MRSVSAKADTLGEHAHPLLFRTLPFLPALHLETALDDHELSAVERLGDTPRLLAKHEYVELLATPARATKRQELDIAAHSQKADRTTVLELTNIGLGHQPPAQHDLIELTLRHHTAP